MKYIPITEAIKRLGKSDRQVRRMVHSGKLAYDYAPDKKLLILASDIDKVIRQSRPPQEIERLDRLEQELIQLRERLDALSSQVDTLTAPRERSPQKSIVRPITHDLPPLVPGERLPDGYVPIYDLIKEHGLVRQRNAIMRYMRKYGYLKTGHWNVGGHEVKNALDQEGVKEFMEGFVTQEPLQ